jgi:hypothetical protein
MDDEIDDELVRKAQAVHKEGTEELQAANRIPRPMETRSVGPRLEIPDLPLMAGALSTASGELARLLGALLDLIATENLRTNGINIASAPLSSPSTSPSEK